MRRLAVLVAVAALAGCGEDEPATSAGGEVRALENVLVLRSDFEADAGKPRVLVLLSPT